uniref:ATP synthase F0 subunit 8 n=1 Tax=Ceratodoris hiroi TaxID=1505000 RepID=A0A888YSI3_9GAST|nr:ATP synthase F0 subunit 8 [Ceratodoris hiroi]QRC77956.1 ATP synthase F0 subunit 8 [Ceratodoris hiroi]
MPQLSPMLGFVMFLVVLSLYIVLLCGMSKKTPFLKTSKMGKSNKMSFHFFN